MDFFQNDVTVAELVQMCKIVTNQNDKHALLAQLADNLSIDNFSSLDERLTQDIQEICSQIYSKNMLILFKRILITLQMDVGVKEEVVEPLSPLQKQGGVTTSREVVRANQIEQPARGEKRVASDLEHELDSCKVLEPARLILGMNDVASSRLSCLGLFNILVISDKHIFNDKFKCKTAETVFKFNNIPQDIVKFPSYINKAFDEIVSFITKDALPHDKILMKISMSKFNAIKPICINLLTVSELKSDLIASRLESTVQSNSCFLITDSLEISSVLIKIPHGKGRTSPKSADTKEFLKRKSKSLIDIELDNPIYCLPTAILLGKCLADKTSIRKYMFPNHNILIEDVIKLNTLADVKTDAQFGSNVIQLAAYQRALPNHNIVVYNDRLNYKSKLFNNSNNTIGGKGTINIFYFEDISHFVAIRDVRLFFNKRYECDICSQIYNLKRDHTCLNSNKLCAPPNCSECSNMIDSGHNCYVQKYEENPPTKFLIIFYELVCTQHLDIQSDGYRHEPILCATHMVCEQCFMITKSDYCCPVCGCRQRIFENNDQGKCIEQFVGFCELIHKKEIPVFCITHNLKAFEGQFLLRELVKRKKDIQQIMGGMTMYKINYNSRINFIDSLNFLPVPLSKFPETFQLQNVATGWYPKLFNTSQNYNYIGRMPDKKYFDTNHMLENEFNQFNIWYDERSSSGLVYDNRLELINYCSQGVDILRRGCITFMTNFLNHTDINPLLQAVTLSQAVMFAFRKKFMHENTLSVLHPNLYHQFSKNQTITGVKWLIYENQNCKYEIMHDVNLPSTKYYVDGYCINTNTVYEFLVCYWHGCERCFLNRTQPLSGDIKDTFNFRYGQICSKFDVIKLFGYKIISTWECKFKDVLLKNPEIDEFLKKNTKIREKHLNPIDALFEGRRSKIFQMNYKAKDGEKIRHYDFASLYAYVNKTGKHPIQHPKLYKMIDCKNLDIHNMDGLIKCAILPPHDLLVPILPVKINNDIVYPLCRTCTEKQMATCSHSDTERMLIGTWVLDEIKLSINHGYIICDIFELWEYEIAQYDIHEKTGGIFTEFTNYFLKLKQEASGWPANITSEIERDEFIKEFSSREGIDLDASAIKNNQSQRDYYRLALNALWERTDVCDQTTVIQNVSELYALVSSAGAVITDIISLGDVLWISWKHSAPDISEQFKHVPFPIGAFTAANARIKLYSDLTKISDNIIYCDTDSIIFVEDNRTKCVLKTGNFTGDLTDAIYAYGENAYITEFTCTGPKSYAYIIFDPDKNKYFATAKYKGITLNLESKNLTKEENIVDNIDNVEIQVINDNKKIKTENY